jgi:quercetin dioxygenase-like cupin family protein
MTPTASGCHERRRRFLEIPVEVCHGAGMSLDPVETNPEHYKVVFENDRVRVLEYTDRPGDQTTPHQHPDSVMYTLSAFRRRLVSGDIHRQVEMQAGSVGWLPAQEHHGENIGDTPTHVVFVELKEAAPETAWSGRREEGGLGPQSS